MRDKMPFIFRKRINSTIPNIIQPELQTTRIIKKRRRDRIKSNRLKKRLLTDVIVIEHIRFMNAFYLLAELERANTRRSLRDGRIGFVCKLQMAFLIPRINGLVHGIKMLPFRFTNHLPQENGKRRPKNQPKNIQSRVMIIHAPKNKKIAMPSMVFSLSDAL